MRVLFFVARFSPAVGGVEKYISELSRAVADNGHEVAVITGAHRDGLAARETHEGVTIHRYPAHRAPWRARLGLMKLKRVVRAADVVHVSDVLMLERFRSVFGPLRSGGVLCMTRHGLSCRWPVPHAEIARARAAATHVDATVDDGYFIAKWLGVPCDAVIDQGLNPQADAITPKPRPQKPAAVYIGRLAWDTGIEMYVDGIDLLRTRHGINLPLLVFGSGPLASHVRASAERRRLPITIHDAAGDAQEVLSDATLAFVSGRMAIQEAMARRRPVVAACVNPLRLDYVLGEPFGPFVATARSGVELADKAARLLQNPSLADSIVDRAHHLVRELSWARTADAYIRVWTTALVRKQSRSTGDAIGPHDSASNNARRSRTKVSACR